jgi:hypothetical protein
MSPFLPILPASARRMYRGRCFHKPMTEAERRHEFELMEALTQCNVSGVQQAAQAEQLRAMSELPKFG